ncbi:hypothetical protein HHL17_32010 [Chitinophaga sp. G-6-1-13]|uniref:Uncharacterized protein n=1 Tax=Chitinophaga fulva TaxID=2728842 RepID=A0A848GZ55_9BACT|nr:hypothetical protein [Chitinophaga fulva]NML41853.1 hypothetical protein [Chitinophaga fulva]
MAKQRKPAGQPDGSEHYTEREETGEFRQTEETNNYGIVQPNPPSQEDQEEPEDQEELEFDEDLDENSEEEIDEENP